MKKHNSSKHTANPNSAAHKKGRRTSRLARLLIFLRRAVCILAVLLAIAIIIRINTALPTEKAITKHIESGVMIPGISINGIDISGLTVSEAKSAVLPTVREALESTNITIVNDTCLWVLTSADLDIVTNLDEILSETIMLGFDGTRRENRKLKEEIAAEGRKYNVRLIPNPSAIKEALSKIGDKVNTDPVDPVAVPITTGNKPDFSYVEGTNGYMLNEDALCSSILTLIDSGTLSAVLTPELEYAEPELSPDDIMENVQLVSKFQTSFNGSRAARNENRVGNIQRACTMLNGLTVQNGEEFSFNGFIGPRTEAGGWPLAPGIINGNQYEDQAGGGICQVSTTMYNALLCAGASMQRGSTLDEILSAGIEGISITERKHHTWPSSYVDTGLDSTVTGTVKDGKSLDFVNNTGYPIYVFAYCDTSDYTVTIYVYGKPLPAGTEYKVRGEVDEVLKATTETKYDTTQPADYSEVTIKARDGYKASVYRDEYIDGELAGTEKLYVDTYNAVTGEVVKGTGGAPAPKA